MSLSSVAALEQEPMHRPASCAAFAFPSSCTVLPPGLCQRTTVEKRLAKQQNPRAETSFGEKETPSHYQNCSVGIDANSALLQRETYFWHSSKDGLPYWVWKTGVQCISPHLALLHLPRVGMCCQLRVAISQKDEHWQWSDPGLMKTRMYPGATVRKDGRRRRGPLVTPKPETVWRLGQPKLQV